MQLVFRYIGSHLFAFLVPFSLDVEPKKLTGKDRISRKPPPLPAIFMELNDHLSVYNSYIHVPERTKRQTGERERHHPAHHWMQALQSLLVIMLLPVLPKSWLLLSFSTGRQTACASKPPWICSIDLLCCERKKLTREKRKFFIACTEANINVWQS